MTHRRNHPCPRSSRRTRRALTAAASVVALLVLAGCGEGDSAEETRTTARGDEFNDADVTFATDMIPHHAQALVMVDMTLGRDLDPEFSALTEDIRATQTPEIEQMADWLVLFDEPVPETSRDHANSHSDSMDMGDMPGMMSQDELAELEDSPDDQFEQMWLEMMIAHHEGAVEMAQQEQAEGAFPPAIDLAADIEASQTEEISVMEDLQDQLTS